MAELPKMESGELASTDGVDARDGLTRLERVILWQLREAQRELGRASVPTALLYGRVVEHVPVSVEEFQRVLQRLVGSRY
jgi:hypothetical protein